jgi:hypothetical protein
MEACGIKKLILCHSWYTDEASRAKGNFFLRYRYLISVSFTVLQESLKLAYQIRTHKITVKTVFRVH